MRVRILIQGNLAYNCSFVLFTLSLGVIAGLGSLLRAINIIFDWVGGCKITLEVWLEQFIKSEKTFSFLGWLKHNIESNYHANM